MSQHIYFHQSVTMFQPEIYGLPHNTCSYEPAVWTQIAIVELSCSHAAPSVWNDLPVDIRRSVSRPFSNSNTYALLSTSFYKLITWLLPLPRLDRQTSTCGASTDTLNSSSSNNNNNNNKDLWHAISIMTCRHNSVEDESVTLQSACNRTNEWLIYGHQLCEC